MSSNALHRRVLRPVELPTLCGTGTLQSRMRDGARRFSLARCAHSYSKHRDTYVHPLHRLAIDCLGFCPVAEKRALN
jgi:hypothetical protein